MFEMRSRKARRRETGLTLMELMSTLAIVSVGILGLTSMNFQSARAVQDAAEIALASNLANAAIDELQVGDYDSYLAGAVIGFPIYFDKVGRALPADTDRYFEVNARVTDDTLPLYKDIEVTVTWKDSEVGGAETNASGNRRVVMQGRLRQLAQGTP